MFSMCSELLGYHNLCSPGRAKKSFQCEIDTTYRPIYKELVKEGGAKNWCLQWGRGVRVFLQGRTPTKKSQGFIFKYNSLLLQNNWWGLKMHQTLQDWKYSFLFLLHQHSLRPKNQKCVSKFVIRFLSIQNSANYTRFFLRSLWKSYPQLKIFILAVVVTLIRYGNIIIYHNIKATKKP